METAHRAKLAKGEVEIRECKIVPTLSEFADQRFLPLLTRGLRVNPKPSNTIKLVSNV
jgi:hypothetical protein